MDKYVIYIRSEEKTSIQKRGTNVQLANDDGEYYKQRNSEYPTSCVGFGPAPKTLLIKSDLDKLEKTFWDFSDLKSYFERDENNKRRKTTAYKEEVKHSKQMEKLVENAKAPAKLPNLSLVAKWYGQYEQQDVPLDTFMQTSTGRAIKSFHQFIKDSIV